MSHTLDKPPQEPAPTRATSTPPATEPALSPTELAARHGLTASGARPSLPSYVRQLWQRRHFITAFATAKLTAQYNRARLGQLWQVLTPLLNAAVYYLVFGVLVDTRRGVEDFVPFLVTGVFVFTFTQSSALTGTRAISGNLGLVRALHFPRAALPLALCLQQLQQLLFSMAALAVILLGFGVPVTTSWLLAPGVLALQFLFNAGLALAVARLGSKTPDIAQLMPFLLRTWMYGSGVMFSLQSKLEGRDIPEFVRTALEFNPAAVFIDLMRYVLIDSFHTAQPPGQATTWWITAACWAVVVGVGGFIWFWKAEETYGRG
ncbi:Teichoic acid translocation permease protein TagG [Streptomyces sp. YIM 130001]|uniref:ABC transporter permease n=1 Tax=Streptomyces sp. YIM 130001 TaxID=2259644 RepID=UPI000E65C96F|nr:ABC transporter permease [Streptomyces sp. YIM 130001]RII19859.1 Teichoic acid translocation permease protein TagG [Streptomyces sp. YIM 130001]